MAGYWALEHRMAIFVRLLRGGSVQHDPDCFGGVGYLHHDFLQVFSLSGPLVADISLLATTIGLDGTRGKVSDGVAARNADSEFWSVRRSIAS